MRRPPASASPTPAMPPTQRQRQRFAHDQRRNGVALGAEVTRSPIARYGSKPHETSGRRARRRRAASTAPPRKAAMTVTSRSCTRDSSMRPSTVSIRIGAVASRLLTADRSAAHIDRLPAARTSHSRLLAFRICGVCV